MTDRRAQDMAEQSNMQKDPDDWVTGDEPMTGAQRSYLHTLAEEAHEEIPDDLSKAQASKKIDQLQEKTGRGTPSHNDHRADASEANNQAEETTAASGFTGT
jgi:hypothetical protein